MLMTNWESAQLVLRAKIPNGCHMKEKMEQNRQNDNRAKCSRSILCFFPIRKFNFNLIKLKMSAENKMAGRCKLF